MRRQRVRWSTLAILAIPILLMLSTNISFGQNLALSSGTAGSNGTISLNLNLTSAAGNEPAGVQWTLTYPLSNVVFISASPGATGAGKTLSCSSSSGAYTCLASGMNAAIIPNGTIAVVNLTMAAGTSTTSIGISNSLGASPSGNAMSLTGTGGTVTGGGPVPPTVSSLSCTPTTLSNSGSSTC